MLRLRVVAAPVAGLIVSLALFAATRGLDDVAREGQLGPGFWPRLVLLGLALTCATKLAADWGRARSLRDDPHATSAAVPRAPIARGTLAAAIALILLDALLTPVLGFAATTLGFIAAFMWLAGARSVASIAANAVGGTVVLLYVFVKFVYLPLPKGEGPIESLTLALYRALHLF